MKPLDLTKFKRPKTAATKLYEWCCARSRDLNQNPDQEVMLLDPAHSDRLGYGKVWRVMWESGPYEWGILLTLGESYLNAEVSGMAVSVEAEFGVKLKPRAAEVILTQSPHWTTEPYYSFDVGFYPL